MANLKTRARRAADRQTSALNCFYHAANQLKIAATKHRALAAEHDDLARAHSGHAGNAVQKAVEAEQAAAKLRELVGA